MIRIVLYPLAAVGAATVALIATCAAVTRQERRIDDARLVAQLRALADAQPPAPSDESLAELEQMWADS